MEKLHPEIKEINLIRHFGKLNCIYDPLKGNYQKYILLIKMSQNSTNFHYYNFILFKNIEIADINFINLRSEIQGDKNV